MELGLATFADLANGASPAQRMRELMQEAELADQLGLDAFAIGEHHRPDFLVSSPAVILGAIAVNQSCVRRQRAEKRRSPQPAPRPPLAWSSARAVSRDAGT
jgi:hypothetical protein